MKPSNEQRGNLKGERMRPIKSFSTFCEDKMDSPTDAQGRILHKFTMSLDAYMNELIEMKEVCDTVEVTLTDDEPYKEVLRFHVAEASGD
jgi:hypothetical protein